MSETESGKENQIIKQLRDGNQDALVDLYHDNYAMVRNYVLNNNGVQEDAEDLLQEALVVLWQNVRKPGFELTSKISTYIMAVVKNQWLKQLGKNKRMAGEEQISPYLHSETPVAGKELDYKIVREALDEIGETCRNVLVMFYFDGFDMDTIAQNLGFNNSDTAKAKKYQCFKKLEELMKKRYSISDFLR